MCAGSGSAGPRSQVVAIAGQKPASGRQFHGPQAARPDKGASGDNMFRESREQRRNGAPDTKRGRAQPLREPIFSRPRAETVSPEDRISFPREARVPTQPVRQKSKKTERLNGVRRDTGRPNGSGLQRHTKLDTMEKLPGEQMRVTVESMTVPKVRRNGSQSRPERGKRRAHPKFGTSSLKGWIGSAILAASEARQSVADATTGCLSGQAEHA